jgi:hypothetical protein
MYAVEPGRETIQKHQTLTQSHVAKRVLANFDAYLPKFVKVYPDDYRYIRACPFGASRQVRPSGMLTRMGCCIHPVQEGVGGGEGEGQGRGRDGEGRGVLQRQRQREWVRGPQQRGGERPVGQGRFGERRLWRLWTSVFVR